MPPDIKDVDIIDKTEIEIDKVTAGELAEREEGVPYYKEKIEYNEDQIIRLKDEIFKGYDRLKRKREDYDTKWEGLEAQYEGEMADDSNLEFSLDVPITQVKIDSGTRLALKAMVESDPKFTITARPGTAKKDKWETTVTRQADYLDYKLDEDIDVITPLRRALHQAWLLDCGLVKMPYEFLRKKMKREEHFSGKVEQDEQGNVRIPGLESFLRQYPEAKDPGNEGHWAFKDLMNQKDVTFKAEYMEVVYDDPKPSYVDIKDFFVDPRCDGYEGLCNSQLTIERQDYTWWELKKAEQNEDFENVDECKRRANEDGTEDDKKAEDDGEDVDDGDYKTRDYEVLECVYHFNEEDSDDVDDEVKIICWFEARSKAYLGSILYPYDGVEAYYIPFYIKDKKAGFYKGGMAEDLTDSHLAQNAMLNFMLTESWQQLMTTPIIRKGSPIADQFTYKRWKPGLPLEVPESSMNVSADLSFLDKPQRAVAAQLIPVILFLAKMDDDRTGISSLATGKESPTDPTAPAAKTAMLLQQSGINISDYINCLVPSFNLMGQIILLLTYQMAHEGRPFKQKQMASKVSGDPFEALTRDEMIAKTNIQSRAASFDFDKINEKREMLAFYQLVRQDPIFAKNPEGIYSLARILTSSWSPTLKNRIDQLLPNPQEFAKGQFQVCLQALGLYMQQMQKQSQVTGVQGDPNFKEFVGMATQMMAQAVTPPPEEK